MKLLIVDDDRIAIEGLMASVNWADLGIDSAQFALNGAQAYQILKADKIDIMLCDIEMPKESGIELVRRVKKEKIDVEVIFLTCHAKFVYAQEAIQLGCDNYLLRPLPFEAIGKAVAECARKLNERRYDQELKEYGAQWVAARAADDDEKRNSIPKDSVKEVEAFVMNNIDREDLSVSMIARHCCLNSDYLNRIFKRKKGVSISRYILEYRMKVAAHMLKNENMTASAVASKVGYKNYPYFSTLFKKTYKCMPSEYKNEFTNEKGNQDE